MLWLPRSLLSLITMPFPIVRNARSIGERDNRNGLSFAWQPRRSGYFARAAADYFHPVLMDTSEIRVVLAV